MTAIAWNVVLKRSDVEATELVCFEGSGGGSLGPFVRKRIDASAQIGGAYERLFSAQRAGRRFEHLPRIVDCRRVGDELDVVMEYIEGETLEALVGRLGATPDYARGLFPALVMRWQSSMLDLARWEKRRLRLSIATLNLRTSSCRV